MAVASIRVTLKEGVAFYQGSTLKGSSKWTFSRFREDGSLDPRPARLPSRIFRKKKKHARKRR